MGELTTQEHLHELERAFGFTYPPSFVSGLEEFSVFLARESLQIAFHDTRLLLSASEIAAARENIPASLLPFLREEQPSWPDIYAFDLESGKPEFRVVVWSDHAVVMDWRSFPIFVRWIREIIAKPDKMIEDEIQTIVASLRPEDRDYIRDLSEDRLMDLHRTLGLNLRNDFRANKYPCLFARCDQQQTPETRSVDSISEAAIKLIWEHLRRGTDVA